MTQQFTEDVEIQGNLEAEGNLQIGDDPGSTNAIAEVHRDKLSTGKPKRGFQADGEIENEDNPSGTVTWSNHEVAVSGATTDVTQVTALRASAQSADGSVDSLVGIEANVNPVSGTVAEAIGLNIPDVTGATNNYAIKTGQGDVYLGDTLQLSDTLKFEELSSEPSGEIGTIQVYARNDGKLYQKSGTSAETPLGEGIQSTIDLPVVVQGGRLTTSSTLPYYDANTTSASTIYFLPFGPMSGNIALYDTSDGVWRVHQFTTLSTSLSGLSSSTMYEIFVYDDAGTLTLIVEDASLAKQDGVYVKSGDVSRRFVGVLRTNSSTTIADEDTRRFLINHDNKMPLPFRGTSTIDSYTTTSTLTRQWLNSSGSRVEFLSTPDGTYYEATFTAVGTGPIFFGIGINSTSSNSADTFAGGDGIESVARISGIFSGTAVDYHYLQPLQVNSAATTTVTYGDAGVSYAQYGLTGYVMG